jgi:hypothetical protein
MFKVDNPDTPKTALPITGRFESCFITAGCSFCVEIGYKQSKTIFPQNNVGILDMKTPIKQKVKKNKLKSNINEMTISLQILKKFYTVNSRKSPHIFSNNLIRTILMGKNQKLI